MCGSTTVSVNPAATAASNALPPASSTRIPTPDASQCVEATMPKVPVRTGRVVNTSDPASPRGAPTQGDGGRAPLNAS